MQWAYKAHYVFPCVGLYVLVHQQNITMFCNFASTAELMIFVVVTWLHYSIQQIAWWQTEVKTIFSMGKSVCCFLSALANAGIIKKAAMWPL